MRRRAPLSEILFWHEQAMRRRWREWQRPTTKGEPMTLEIVSREACGLVPERENPGTLSTDEVSHIVVHHETAPPPTDPHGGHDEAHDMAAGQWRSIQGYYVNTRGYADTPYHYGIAPDGVAYEGRHLDRVGAHALGCNRTSIGVCFLGIDAFTDAALHTYALLAEHIEGVIGHSLADEPHSACTATACPGDTLRYLIDHGSLRHGEAPEVHPTPHVTACAALPAGPPPHGIPTLREGARGNLVAFVQTRLAELHHEPTQSRKADGRFDGIFGPGTANAVRSLQGNAGIQVDGVIGRQTWCVLGVR